MKRFRAFSLIEVVLALGVVTFALVAILGVFPAAFNLNRKAVDDTRAGELARMVIATIDAQCATFSNINCFGATLDLAGSDTDTPPVTLYAEYPSPNQPQITSVKATNSIYSLEIRFSNAPVIASPSTILPIGIVNQLQIRVRALSMTSTDFMEFIYLARKKN